MNKTDFERWDDAVKTFRAALWVERKTIIAFLGGWLSAALVLTVIWLIAPERFC